MQNEETSTQQSAVSLQSRKTSTQHSEGSTQSPETSIQQAAVGIQSLNDNDAQKPSTGGQPSAEKKAVSGQDIIAAIRKMAERLGRYPSMPELTQAHPAIKMGTVRKYFAGYGDALREAGFEGGGYGYTVTMDALFRDWARLARKYQRCPTMGEYERESKYSVRPLVGRFRVWSQAPRGLYGYAEQKELDVEFGDVMEMIRGHYGEAKPKTFETRRNGVRGGSPTEKTLPLMNADMTGQKGQDVALDLERLDPRRWEAREMRLRKAPVLPDRPIFGPPMVDMALACGPTCENGVIYLFGSLARQLGFVVMRIQTEFPDCLALRYIGDDRWQLIRIEFEYESRNFLKHLHDAKKCDLIVCWEHNWKECPIEVIELREIVKAVGWAM